MKGNSKFENKNEFPFFFRSARYCDSFEASTEAGGSKRFDLYWVTPKKPKRRIEPEGMLLHADQGFSTLFGTPS